MDTLDTLMLSRIQFAANISFHILFPTITIGLGWVLLFFRLSFARTGDEKWMAAYRFWVKIFALSFALGVVSGITMSLSVARPIFSAPGGTSAEDPGRRILSMDVARADPEPPRAGDGPIWVGAASSDRAGAGVGARGRVGAGVGWVGGRVGGRVG